MRKRYTAKYTHWSPRFKWRKRDLVGLIEFEREWKGWRGRRRNPPDCCKKRGMV